MTRKNAIWLTDMKKCLPAENLAAVRHKGTWKPVSYELKNGINGYLIYAVYQSEARPVRLPLEQKGEYDIYIGLWNNNLVGDSFIRVKLSGDSCYTVISNKTDAHCVADFFFKRATLNKQDLWIAQANLAEQNKMASLAYVRLEPVEKKEKPVPVSRKFPLVATNDGSSNIGTRGLKSEEDLYEDIEVFRGTDFKKIFWGFWGTVLDWGSVDYEKAMCSGHTIYSYPWMAKFIEAAGEFHRRKINVLKCVSDYAKKAGLDFQLYYRTELFGMEPVFEEDFASDFFRQNPQWRCLSRDGRKTNQLSYAFPEVRRRVLKVIGEAFSITGAAGINLTFVRGGPCVLYEISVLDAFKKETGLDARKMKIDDERFLKFKAKYVTKFILETRVFLDKISKPGQQKELSVHVYCDRKSNLRNGFDVEDWVNRKLVDLVVVWPQATNMQYHYNPDPKRIGYLSRANYRYFHQICGRNKIPFYLCIFTCRAGQESVGELVRLVQDAYRNGVDGLVFWDADSNFNPSLTEVMRRMGDREWIMSLNPAKFKKQPTFPLKELDGFMMDKYWSWLGA